MEPTYHSWQLTLIDKRADAPKAGTVVAVRCNALNAVIVKRVVAVPGDSLIIKDGILSCGILSERRDCREYYSFKRK